ncbi:unnamed protein product, partial [Mesorhabditis belari]|uniref:Uncharacterized protein n=1 Tax=Mesorhabditis belari TaxID=2138241 RepID=A0AAF3FAC9_9BILA
MRSLLIFGLILSNFSVIDAFKIGAILREKEDAHIAAAIQYAVEWLNQRAIYGQVDFVIDYIDVLDHYEAVLKACSLFEKDHVVALIGSSHPMLNAQLERLAAQMDIPLLTAVDDLGLNANTDVRIEFFPKAQLFESIVDLFRHWRWNRITIVYEENERIRRIEPLLEDDAYSSIRFRLVKIQNKDYMRAARDVKELEECSFYQRKDCSEFSRILLDLNPEHAYNFLLAGLQMGLIELKHWFLLTSMELSTMDMELFRYNHARYISPYPVDPIFLKEKAHVFNFSHFKHHIAENWNTRTGFSRNLKLTEAIFTFDSIYAFASVFSDVVHSQSQLVHDIPQTTCRKPGREARKYQYGRTLIDAVLNNKVVGISGDLHRVGHPMKSNFSMRIHLLGYSGRLDDIGFWEPKTDVHVNMTGDSRAQLQKNVQVSDELKPHFRVTTIMERPYVMLKKNHFELDANSKFEGFCIDLLAELSKDLGFTYSVHLVKDGAYGNDVHGNGSWDGMIGEILRGEAEMAVAPLTVNFKRAEVVDFTKPFLSLGISILFKVPDDQQPDLFSFLNPLSWQIWMAILTAIAGVTVGMFVVARITPYEWNLNFSCCTAHQPHPGATFNADSEPVQLSNNYSFWNTLWYVTSTMLKGGCDFGPRAVSTRLLGGTWWVFTLVIISAYTANLAAVLTVSRPFIPIKNLDDLANQSTIAYGTIKGGSTMQFFQESRIGSHVRMWEYMKDRDVFVKDNTQGVLRGIRENYAYLMESTSLEYEVQQNCNLTQIGGVLGSKGYGIALQKKSEWTDRISRQILLYAKRGIIEMKKTKWWRSKGASCQGGGAVKQQRFSLSFHNVAGLFIILIAGLLFGLITVIIELLIRSRQMAKKDKKPIVNEIRDELKFALNLNKPTEHRSRQKTLKAAETTNGQTVNGK